MNKIKSTVSRKYLNRKTKITIRRSVRGTESSQTFDTTVDDALRPAPCGNDFKTQRGTVIVRANTCTCGYCGRQEDVSTAGEFCMQCIGYPLLRRSDLHLTRMLPVVKSDNRAPLSAAEQEILYPLYEYAQIHGATDRDKARIAARRVEIAEQFAKDVRHAQMERDCATWCLDNGVDIDHVIYYKHLGRFCFGWNNRLDADTRVRLIEKLVTFPFEYDIK